MLKLTLTPGERYITEPCEDYVVSDMILEINSAIGPYGLVIKDGNHTCTLGKGSDFRAFVSSRKDNEAYGMLTKHPGKAWFFVVDAGGKEAESCVLKELGAAELYPVSLK